MNSVKIELLETYIRGAKEVFNEYEGNAIDPSMSSAIEERFNVFIRGWVKHPYFYGMDTSNFGVKVTQHEVEDGRVDVTPNKYLAPILEQLTAECADKDKEMNEAQELQQATDVEITAMGVGVGETQEGFPEQMLTVVATQEQFVKYMVLSSLATGFVDLQNKVFSEHSQVDMNEEVRVSLEKAMNDGIQVWAAHTWFDGKAREELTVAVEVNEEEHVVKVVPSEAMYNTLTELAAAVEEVSPKDGKILADGREVADLEDAESAISFIDYFIETFGADSMVFIGKQRYRDCYLAFIASEDFGGVLQRLLTDGVDDFSIAMNGPLVSEWYPVADAKTPMEALLRLEHRCMTIMGFVEHEPTFKPNYPYLNLNVGQESDLMALWIPLGGVSPLKATALEDVASGVLAEEINVLLMAQDH